MSVQKLGKSPIKKRSCVIQMQKTSISLENAYWAGVKALCAAKAVPTLIEVKLDDGSKENRWSFETGALEPTISELIGGIDEQREQHNLSSTIRLVILAYYQELAAGKKAKAA